MTTFSSPPLTDTEIGILHTFFADTKTENPDFELNYSILCGFLAGIISGPEIMFPKTWMMILLGDEPTPAFQERVIRDDIIEIMKRLYNHIAEALQNRTCPAPSCYPAHPTLLAGTYDEAAIADWCGGFYDAISMNEDWFTVEPFVAMLFPIVANIIDFDDEAYAELIESENKSAEELRREMIPEISEAMFSLYAFILQMKFCVPGDLDYPYHDQQEYNTDTPSDQSDETVLH